jgi:3-oxoacyl-[acyl-carrier-protein] synthase-3
MREPAAKIALRGPHFVLGDVTLHHTGIPGFDDGVARHRMAPVADLWGWGDVHRSSAGIDVLAIRAAQGCLRDAGVTAAEVDALVLCSSTLPEGVAAHADLVRSVLTGLGMEDVPVTGVTLNRCGNLLAGLILARALVAAGDHHRVLVVTTDRVTVESGRMTGSALLSDGAAACLITGWAPDAPYGWVMGAVAQDPALLSEDGQLSAELAATVNARLTKETGIVPTAIDAVLGTNMYLPIVTMKETQAGFRREQLHTATIPTAGHCFAADPLINLVDRQRTGRIRPGGHYLLAAAVPGMRIGVLLRAGGGGAA